MVHLSLIAVIVSVFINALVTFLTFVAQLGKNNKKQIFASTLEPALYIFTLFGIWLLGIDRGLKLIRGIMPGYAEWASSGSIAQNVPANFRCENQKVKGARAFGWSLLLYCAATIFVLIYLGILNAKYNPNYQ